MNKESPLEKIIEELLQLTGLNDPQLIVAYLKQKRSKLLTNSASIDCIGNVQLPIRDYQVKGVHGFLQYGRDSYLKDLPILPIAFPPQYYDEVLFLTENNLNFKVKPLSLNMNFVLARSEFWKIFINTALVELFKSTSIDDKPLSSVIQEDEWNVLRPILEKLWAHKKFQPLKSITLENNKTYTGGIITTTGMGNSRKRKIEGGEEQESRIEEISAKESKWLIFPKSDSFEDCIWKPICYYFLNPYLNTKSKTIGGDKDTRVRNSISTKPTCFIILDDDNNDDQHDLQEITNN